MQQIRSKIAGAHRRACIVLCLALMAIAPSAQADVPSSVLQRMGLGSFETARARAVEAVQKDLSWIGLFSGQINGEADRRTRNAIMLFQRGLGDRETGDLTSAQQKLLATRAQKMRRRADFRNELIDWVGMQLDLPRAFIGDVTITGGENLDVVMYGRDAASTTVTLDRRFVSSSASRWEEVMRNWATEGELEILTSGTSGGFSFVIAQNSARRIYWLYETRSSETRGIEINVEVASITSLRPVVGRMLERFEAFAGRGVSKDQVNERLRTGDYPGAENQPDWYRSMRGNGSGSIVSRNGHVLTNHHVVAGCGRLTVNGTEATLVGSDVSLDLAVVRAPRLSGRDPIRFAARAIELGEPLYVLGYPVYSISPSLNATTGVVSSQTGFRGDRTRIQITAPVQPGNSGGPVISKNGAQVGVVASKVSSSLQVESNIENIGYAVRSAEAEEFLEDFGVEPEKAPDAYSDPDNTVADSMRLWRRLAVRVECHS